MFSSTTLFVRDFWSLPLLCATPVGRMVEQMTRRIDDKPVRPAGLLTGREVNRRLLKGRTCLQNILEENHAGDPLARKCMAEFKKFEGITETSLTEYLLSKGLKE